MSSTRKLKRQLLKDWAREGKKPSEQVARVAAQEMSKTRDAAAKFGYDIIGVAVLSIVHDYGKLKDRTTRVETAVELINKRFHALRDGKLSQKEKDTLRAFSAAFSEHWVSYDEEQGGKDHEEKK